MDGAPLVYTPGHKIYPMTCLNTSVFIYTKRGRFEPEKLSWKMSPSFTSLALIASLALASPGEKTVLN